MTPNARKKQLDNLKQICLDFGFKPDSYGNYLLPSHKDFRIKFMKVNVRFEYKAGDRWISANYSKPYSQVDLKDFEDRVSSRVRRYKSQEPKAKPREEKGVPLVPALNDPQKAADIQKLIEQRNHADYQCFMLLRKLRELGLLMSPSDKNTYLDASDFTEEQTEALESVDELIKERIELNDQLLKKVAGKTPEGKKPSVTIPSKYHSIADEFLMTPEWKDRHGYMGMPSRKTFSFNSEEDRQKFLDYLTAKEVPYELDKF